MKYRWRLSKEVFRVQLAGHSWSEGERAAEQWIRRSGLQKLLKRLCGG